MITLEDIAEFLKRIVDALDFGAAAGLLEAELPPAADQTTEEIISRDYPNLRSADQAVRDALVDVAKEIGLKPEDLSDVIQSESGWDPTEPEKETGTPRAGLLQLTVGANQPGYQTAEAVWALRKMPAERQLRDVFLPYLKGLPLAKIKDAYTLYKWIFVPKEANLGPEGLVCDVTSDPQKNRAICLANPAFDRNKDGKIQWLEVFERINEVRRQARGQWLTRSGKVVSRPDDVPGSIIPKGELASPAPALLLLREQLNKAWPKRPKASDGIMGDARHRARKSDHHDGNAMDITRGPGGPDTRDLIKVFLADPRVTIVIHERRIYKRGGAAEGQPYKGKDPHERHAHVSIRADAREDLTPWDLTHVGTIQGEPGSAAAEAIMKGLPWALDQGLVDDVLWIPLQFKELVLTVSAEFLSVDGVRVPLSWEEELAICRKFKCIPCTQAVVDRRWELADRRLVVTPEAPEALTTAKGVEQVLRVNARLPSPSPAVLAEGFKHWILDKATLSTPTNYGLFKNSSDDSPVWQSPGRGHNEKWKDYSQCGVLVSQKAVFQGKEISLLERARASGKYDRAVLDFVGGK